MAMIAFISLSPGRCGRRVRPPSRRRPAARAHPAKGYLENAKFSYLARPDRRYKVRAARKSRSRNRKELGVTAVKWGRMFIGKHVEPARPTNQVDEQLMQRIAEAKQRLVERNIEPVALLRVRPVGKSVHAYR